MNVPGNFNLRDSEPSDCKQGFGLQGTLQCGSGVNLRCEEII